MAVARNKSDMVQYLLEETSLAEGVTKQNETPLFFALSKLKTQTDKVNMVRMFLEAKVNLAHENKEGLTAGEAYLDTSGFDEAVAMIDKH
jgi:hypothetical protein